MDTTGHPSSSTAPGGNLYVGPSLGRSLARLALAIVATPRPPQEPRPAEAGS